MFRIRKFWHTHHYREERLHWENSPVTGVPGIAAKTMKCRCGHTYIKQTEFGRQCDFLSGKGIFA